MADMTRVGMRVRGAEVVTVPIDDTLTIEGQAADAKAVGDALAQKADKSELQAAVKVNNQPADAQGLILIDGRHIPVSDQDTESISKAVKDLKGKTAEDIPMSSDEGSKTIAEAVNENTEALKNIEEATADNIPMENGSTETIKQAIETLDGKAVKSINNKKPDSTGNVEMQIVPLAENLQSDKMQTVDGAFIIRTTAGNSSVSDGKAYPQHIYGTMERAGFVAEVLDMTVIPITRTEPDEPITAAIDRDTFVAYVDESSTINLYYTTEWSEDPELYGVTVTGDPVAGDQIKIEYTKEERGTITVSKPGRLVGTGWNLFSYNNGYARVVKYSDEYGYKIGGTYTSIAFSATLTGERSSITPNENGLFNVENDGYVFVTGGNSTDTYILATWSDWTDGPSNGYWEPYKESGIDLSGVIGTYFPYGMMSISDVRDEIDLTAKRAISRIERKAYSEENRAAAAASGREYTFDENYVYVERETETVSAITIDTDYTVSEHGMEWFTETPKQLITEILYGKNLRDKLERDVLTISAQTLTTEEQAQVRKNIGVMNPPTNGNGSNGQLLQTNGDGTTKWTSQGTPTDDQVGTAVNAWLTAHPEATTTVQDGTITRAKLDTDLKGKTDVVPGVYDDLHHQPEYVPHVGTDRFTIGRSISAQGVPNWNVRACATLDVFDVSNIEKVKWTGEDNTTYAYNANIFFYSDAEGTTIIGNSKSLASNHNKNTVAVPSGAKSARMNFTYYSSTGVDEMTEELFAPYYGVYFESKYLATKIDTTLTKEGQPAEGKATGAAIGNLQTQKNELQDDVRHQHGYTPYVGVDKFTLGKTVNTSGAVDDNERACATVNVFDVSNVENIRWTGADNADAAYNAFVCFYSDTAGTTKISRESLADEHHQRTVMVPSNAKTARINFLYYSGTGIDEITEQLFLPYYGVYFESRYDELENGTDLKVLIPHASGQSGTFETVLAYANGKYILMDFGSATSATSAINKIKQITNKIDVAIISHYHSDHVGGLDSFLDSESGIGFSGCKFYLPPEVDFEDLGPTASERELGTLVERIKGKIETAGGTYEEITEETGEKELYGIRIRFYNIESAKYAIYYETTDASGNAYYNNFSMMNTVTYRGRTLLNTADIVQKAQELNAGAIEENIDVLIAPHHGWNDCDSRFFYAICPKYCAAQNYQPQIPKYVEVLNNRGIEYFSTADCGTIKFMMGSTGVYVSTEASTETNNNRLRYIEENDDLNNLVAAGHYLCTSDSIAESLSHCPVSKMFGMEVLYESARTRKIQVIMDIKSETCKIYMRSRGPSAGTWTSWFVIEGTIVS